MNVTYTACTFLLAQVAVAGSHESYLQSVLHSAGPSACVWVLATGLAVFIGACFVAARCQRPSVIAAYLTLLPLPLIIAIYGAIEASMHSLIIMSSSPAVQPTSTEIAGGIATTLSQLFLSITVTLPSYLLLAIVLIRRTVRAGKGSE
jgi:hypothetical protein